MMVAILSDSDTAILDSDTLLPSPRFTEKHSHSTQLDDGSYLEFCHHSISSQTHSHMSRLVSTICTKKLHSFILTQLDDAAILNSAMLASDTAI